MLDQKEKTSEKALIPLPPTGFVSFFCANPDVVQTKLQATPAVGLHGGSVISFCARFCKEMQRGCTAALQAVTEGAGLEAPVSLGEQLENVGFGRFSKMRRIKFEREITACGEWQIPLQARHDVACRRITVFHSLTLQK